MRKRGTQSLESLYSFLLTNVCCESIIFVRNKLFVETLIF